MFRSIRMRAILLAFAFLLCPERALAQAQTIYLEDFNASLGGWTIYNNITIYPGKWWRTNTCAATSGNHSTPYALRYGNTGCDYFLGTTDGRVISPAIPLTGYASPFTLGFNYFLETEGLGGEPASVWVSSDGINFTLVAANVSEPGAVLLSDPSDIWRAVSINISSIVSTQVYVAFQFHGDAFFFESDGFYFDDVAISGVPEVDTTQIWVDFAYAGAETGTEDHPFNTLDEGANAVDVGETVKIKTGSTSETITIAKAMTLEAVGGAVQIGLTGARSSSDSKTSWQGAQAPVTQIRDLPGTPITLPLEAIGGYLAPDFAQLPQVELSTSSEVRVTEDGLVQAAPGDTLSARLSSAVPIDPESIWHTVLAVEGQRADVSWEPNRPGDMRDLWIRCVPDPEWAPGDIVTVTTGAATTRGEALVPVTWHFKILSPEP